MSRDTETTPPFPDLPERVEVRALHVLRRPLPVPRGPGDTRGLQLFARPPPATPLLTCVEGVHRCTRPMCALLSPVVRPACRVTLSNIRVGTAPISLGSGSAESPECGTAGTALEPSGSAGSRGACAVSGARRGHPSPGHVTPPSAIVSCMAGGEGAAPTHRRGGPGRPPEGTRLGSGIGDSRSGERCQPPRERCPRRCLACALKGHSSRAHIHTESPVLPALQRSRFPISIL